MQKQQNKALVSASSKAAVYELPLINKSITTRNKQAVISSRRIAQIFEKNHLHVLRDVENVLQQLEEGWKIIRQSEMIKLAQKDAPKSGEMSEKDVSKSGYIFNTDAHGLLVPEIRQKAFIKTTYKDKYNRPQPEYILNRSAFDFVVTAYNGVKATIYKALLLARYDAMEAILLEREEKMVLAAKDFVRLHKDGEGFAIVLQNVPSITDSYGRKCYHYLFSLEKLGFSTRAGSVWKRVRNNPNQFLQYQNGYYVTEDFIYNMYLGKVKTHNDKVFRSSNQALLLFNAGGI